MIHRATLLSLIFLALSACAAPGTGQLSGEDAASGKQGVTGKLTHRGRPLKDAIVYAYRGSGGNLLGPADFASGPSAADGSYTIELVRGAYHIVARKRAGGGDTGPIVVGDLSRANPSNPVTVKDGLYTAVDLDLVAMREPMYFQSFSRTKTGTGIRGTITDKEGRPAPWVFAMAYRTGDMKRIPDYTSSMTGADGRYVIYLNRGGTYWLAARKNIREKPVAGEPYGLYAGTPDHSVAVPEGGFVEGIDIQMQEYRKGLQH